MLTILPHRASLIAGSTARAMKKAAATFVAKTCSQWASS
jgi:hypothetical protein